MQEDRCDLDPLTASVYSLANIVYPKDAQLASAAVASALTGFGVALYRGVIMELKVTSADRLCACLSVVPPQKAHDSLEPPAQIPLGKRQ